MKAALLILALALPCFAQRQFEHVLIVVQENRTPDNLFGGNPPLGADVIPVGSPVPLGTTADISHNHASFKKELGGTWPTLAKNYVQNSDVQPYYQLAAQYGFADRMFQTNQGPSEPAHRFLFAATSAPVYPGQLHDDWFVSNNGGSCANLTPVTLIDPAGSEAHNDSGCSDGFTLADLLKANGKTWRYYTPSAGNIWTAPAGIRHICQPVSGRCTGPDWANVVLNPSQVLTDIKNGTLAQVSWAIPAGLNSDHPNYGSGGPAWVAAIVNACGQNPDCWNTTVIIVVWDDWGGWYDHVPPMTNGTGFCMSYCYGYRVPLLVISASTPAGYVSHVPMDLTSILKFVEQNFNLPLIGDGTYADAYANPFDMGFFSLPSVTVFVPIKARKLTRRELEAKDDPDND